MVWSISLAYLVMEVIPAMYQDARVFAYMLSWLDGGFMHAVASATIVVFLEDV